MPDLAEVYTFPPLSSPFSISPLSTLYTSQSKFLSYNNYWKRNVMENPSNYLLVIKMQARKCSERRRGGEGGSEK
jgi:hypothetical protein